MKAFSAFSCIGHFVGLKRAAPLGSSGALPLMAPSTNPLERTIPTLQVGRKPRLLPIWTTMLPVPAPLVISVSLAKFRLLPEKERVLGFSVFGPTEPPGGGHPAPVS